MEYILFFTVIMTVFVLSLIGLTPVFAKRNNRESKGILEKFEPGNYSPKLTTMVNYHKENEIIKYRF